MTTEYYELKNNKQNLGRGLSIVSPYHSIVKRGVGGGMPMPQKMGGNIGFQEYREPLAVMPPQVAEVSPELINPELINPELIVNPELEVMDYGLMAEKSPYYGGYIENTKTGKKTHLGKQRGSKYNTINYGVGKGIERHIIDNTEYYDNADRALEALNSGDMEAFNMYNQQALASKQFQLDKAVNTIRSNRKKAFDAKYNNTPKPKQVAHKDKYPEAMLNATGKQIESEVLRGEEVDVGRRYADVENRYDEVKNANSQTQEVSQFQEAVTKDLGNMQNISEFAKLKDKIETHGSREQIAIFQSVLSSMYPNQYKQLYKQRNK